MLFWLGFMTCAWLATLMGVGYTLYQYVYLPWKVMRKDVVALNTAMEQLRAETKMELGLRRALVPSDEEAARAEVQARTARYLRG